MTVTLGLRKRPNPKGKTLNNMYYENNKMVLE